MEKKKNSRTIQAETTKKALLNVSLALIQKQGYDNVKIEDICTAAGLSIGAFYHHLKSKAGIVNTLYMQCDEYFKDVVFPLFADNITLDSVAEYLTYQVKYGENFGPDICAQVYKAQLTEGREYFLSKNRSITNGLCSIISRLQEKNLIIPWDSQEITQEIFILTRGIIYNWAQNNGNFNIVDTTKKMVNNYLQAYIVK